MQHMNHMAHQGPKVIQKLNPLQFVSMSGGRPSFDFYWKEEGGKRRLIGNPNEPMRALHDLFGKYIRRGLRMMSGGDGYFLRNLKSSTAFVKESNSLKNAARHTGGKYFYITDVRDAYPSVDLVRLAILIVYIQRHRDYCDSFSLAMLTRNSVLQDEIHNDPLFPSVHSFLELFCSGLHGQGLAVGGPLSPFLFNLYCEAYVDAHLRKVCEDYGITYTRYADDLSFSRETPIIAEIRKSLRSHIMSAGFDVNHRKSKVLSIKMGTVFVTKTGLRDSSELQAKLVFPKKKRRKLHKLIFDYIDERMDWPEKVSGYVAEFLYYFKSVEEPTSTDLKTFEFCKRFEAEWAKYR